jgi:hypothetical protein
MYGLQFCRTEGTTLSVSERLELGNGFLHHLSRNATNIFNPTKCSYSCSPCFAGRKVEHNEEYEDEI